MQALPSLDQIYTRLARKPFGHGFCGVIGEVGGKKNPSYVGKLIIDLLTRWVPVIFSVSGWP